MYIYICANNVIGRYSIGKYHQKSIFFEYDLSDERNLGLGLSLVLSEELVDGVTSSEGTIFAPGKTRRTRQKRT